MGLLNRRASVAARSQKIEKEISIVNRLGLHARPAAMFVRIASGYRSEIWVSKEAKFGWQRKAKKSMARASWA